MSTLKRTPSVNKARFKKHPTLWRLSPVALAVTGLLGLAACSEPAPETTENVAIYETAQQCVDANPNDAAACATAFEQAQQEAVATAPKYDSIVACWEEFGKDGCTETPANGVVANAEGQTTEVTQQASSGMSWMPLMAAYMFGRMSGGMGANQFAKKPLYTPKAGAGKGQFFDAKGKSFGPAVAGRSLSVKSSDLAPGKATGQTLKRGGFGQMVAKQSPAASNKSSSNPRSGSRSGSGRSFGG
ncbi:MAG: DUF1190 domain-containing protein [Neisseriaceae bacterium]|nr:DUF1190 domain-containing protein [Neisseriaceae bacterium]MBP6861918.1 DUF1190 domain-containing protein [Neisseriaceae bacterium]